MLTRIAACVSFLVLVPSCGPRTHEPAEPQPPRSSVVDAFKRTVIIHSATSETPKGTGLLVDSKGHFVTCYHVTSGWENEVRISLDAKSFFPARLTYKEPELDLALFETDLRVGVDDLRYGDREDLEINEPIFSVGGAWGLPHTFLRGYVAHQDRTGIDVRHPQIPFIQTMGTSFPGMSGAGVFLYDGRIIGLNRATYGIEAANSTGLVIPAGFLRTFLKLAKDMKKL